MAQSFTASQDITSLVVQALGGSIASGNNASQSTLNLVCILCSTFPRRIKDEKKINRVHISLLVGPYSSLVCCFTGVFGQAVTYTYSVAITAYCGLAAEFLFPY